MRIGVGREDDAHVRGVGPGEDDAAVALVADGEAEPVAVEVAHLLETRGFCEHDDARESADGVAHGRRPFVSVWC